MAQAHPEKVDPSSPFSYKPDQTLLLILDYHTLFVDYISAHAAAEKATTLKAWARSQGVQVAHGLIEAADGVNPPPSMKGSKRTEQILSLLKADKKKWEEPLGLKPDLDNNESNEVVFTRVPGYISALTSRKPMDINQWLAERKYQSIILCGLSTSGCVLRTASQATDAGFVVTVVEDACQDEPETHRIMVEKVLPSRVHVFDYKTFAEQWGAKE